MPENTSPTPDRHLVETFIEEAIEALGWRARDGRPDPQSASDVAEELMLALHDVDESDPAFVKAVRKVAEGRGLTVDI